MDTKNTATDAPVAEVTRSDRPPIRQVSRPCLKCGSMYRRGTACNICGTPQSAMEILREQVIERRPMPAQYSRHGKYHRMEKIVRY